MDTRLYQTQDLDLPRIAQAVVTTYQAQGFEAHQASTPEQAVIQMRHETALSTILGFNKALAVTMKKDDAETLVTVGAQDWMERMSPQTMGQAVNAVIHPVTMALGVRAEHRVVAEVLACIDRQIRQQQPGVQEGVPPLVTSDAVR